MLKKALTTIILFQLLTITALGVLIYYLYNLRFKEEINYVDVRVDVNDNSISKIQAESLTLDSLIKPQDNPNFSESTFNSNSDTQSQVIIQPAYKITDNTILENYTQDAKPVIVPMFYTDINSADLEDSAIISLITSKVKQENLTEIDIDVSIVNKVKNIEDVVKTILSNLNPTNLRINIGLPLKWSDNMDYTYLDSVSRFYKSSASIEILNNLCNKVRISAYGYTSVNSSSAGPITIPELTRDSIKYYISKGLSRLKIDLVINNRAYMWANRSFASQYLYNYVLDSQQVIIIGENELNQYLSSTDFKLVRNLDNGENLGQLLLNGNINYLVYPSLTQISSLKDLAKSYGLNGFILYSEPF